jgi:hypothetical protein
LSPILVRPVREQLEHDRVIRLLQAKYKRKFEVAINPGSEQTTPVGAGPAPWYPDLVLQSTERSRKLLGVVEVETAESVNNLEAMSQWVAFSRLRVKFHLYVPAAYVDSARRMCADLNVSLEEMWAYHSIGDQLRFTLVQRTQSESKIRTPAEPAEASRPRAATPARAAAARATRPPAARPARRAAAPTPTRRPSAAKAKTTAPGRAVKTAARKSVPARAQKRR